MLDITQLDELVKSVEDTKKNLKKAQEELDILEIKGQAEKGMVKVIMNGKPKLKDICISPAMINNNNKNQLENLIIQAINNALEQVNECAINKMQKVIVNTTGGINDVVVNL